PTAHANDSSRSHEGTRRSRRFSWTRSLRALRVSSCLREKPDVNGKMKLGLIAGNGRFPFLVLDAARGAGHDVTVIALKEETFPDLADLASRAPAAAFHWISIGGLGQCISLINAAGVSQYCMVGKVQQAQMLTSRIVWHLA